MTPTPLSPPPSAPPPAPPRPLNRCGGCVMWWAPTSVAALGVCTLVDREQRRDAVACPDWRRAARPGLGRMQ